MKLKRSRNRPAYKPAFPGTKKLSQGSVSKPKDVGWGRPKNQPAPRRVTVDNPTGTI